MRNKSLSKDELRKQVEQAVGARIIPEARALVSQFLKRSNTKTDVFLACDWLRRLGLYREALGLLKVDKNSLNRVFTTDSFEGKKLLWMCRMLNLLGAPHSAMKLSESLKPIQPEDFRILGIIFLTNFEYQKAHDCLSFLCKGHKAGGAYSERMDLLALADSESGLKEYQSAIEIVESLLPYAQDNTEKGIYLQAIGEYQALSRNWGGSKKYFLESQKYFASQDLSADKAFLLKWKGYVEYHLGEQKKAKEDLDEAFRILVNLNVKEEAWLEVLKFKNELGFLNREETVRFFAIQQLLGRDHDFPGNTLATIGKSDARVDIYWQATEASIRRTKTTRRPEVVLGLTKELKLLTILKVTESWGLSLFRAFEFIWPEDVFSLFHAEQRLTDLIRRLKKSFHLEIQIRNQKIYLEPASGERIRIANIFGSPKPSLFAARREFSLQEMMEHYLVSRSAANKWIELWLKENLIEEIEEGAKKKRFRLVHN